MPEVVAAAGGKSIRELLESAMRQFKNLEPAKEPPWTKPSPTPLPELGNKIGRTEYELKKERDAARLASIRAENPEAARAREREYYQQNPGASKKRSMRWQRENPERALYHMRKLVQKRREDPEAHAKYLAYMRMANERKRAEQRSQQAEDPFKMPSRDKPSSVAEYRKEVPHDLPDKEAEQLLAYRAKEREKYDIMGDEMREQRRLARKLKALERQQPIDIDDPDLDALLDKLPPEE